MYTVDDARSFDIDMVKDLYEDFLNPGQVKQISKFGFGNSLVDRAQGIYLTLKCGRVIKDFTGGIGVLNHGHNHPRIMKVRRTYNEDLQMEVHKNFFNPYLAAISANMSELFHGKLSKTYVCNSGAEAVEGALKMAYKAKIKDQGDKILTTDISFHGKLFASGGLSNSPEVSYRWPSPFDQLITKYDEVEDLELMMEKHHKEIFAFILEPFNASSVRICSESYLLKARQLCDRYGVILIFDEVYTGWFKTGFAFNFMRIPDLYPDLVTTSKSFGGGKASSAAFVASNKVFDRAYGSLRDSIIHSTTYNGFGEESVTVLESMNICFDDDYERRAQLISESFVRNLDALKENFPDFISSYSGSGALWGLMFKEDSLNSMVRLAIKSAGSIMMSDTRFVSKLIVSSIIQEMYESHGYLLFFGSNYRIPLKLSVPLNIEIDEIDKFFICLEDVLKTGLNNLVFKFLKNAIV